MSVFITGATGYIGNRLAFTLAESGIQVHALIRSESGKHLLNHPNISVHIGNLLNKSSLETSMRGCKVVYHCAGYVKIWGPDFKEFLNHNVKATEILLNICLEQNIQKVVITSSAGVIGPSLKKPMTENDPRIIAFDNDYELTKHMSEKVVEDYVKKGLNVVIVSPSKVYGPGLFRFSSGVNRYINGFLKQGFLITPYNLDIEHNYVFIDDLINGYQFAMEKGVSGERYLLAGENISYKQFIDALQLITGKRVLVIRIPKNMALLFSYLQLMKGKLLQSDVPLIPKMINRLYRNAAYSNEKAVRELDYNTTSFTVAMKQTINYLNQNSK